MSNNSTTVEDKDNVNHAHDGVFFTVFSLVLGFLIALTVVIAIIANTIDPEKVPDPVRDMLIAERIAPVGAVYTDASQVRAAPAPAAAAELSGSEIVTASCAACHMAGVMNAPKLDATADWEARMAAVGGLDGLVSAAINGKGGMPPRGGAARTDDEIRRAVIAMLEQAGISVE